MDGNGYDDLLKKIDDSHKAIQSMDIRASKENLAIVFDLILTLEDCFRFVNESKIAASAKGGSDGAA